jgi:hypothetical protein
VKRTQTGWKWEKTEKQKKKKKEVDEPRQHYEACDYQLIKYPFLGGFNN